MNRRTSHATPALVEQTLAIHGLWNAAVFLRISTLAACTTCGNNSRKWSSHKPWRIFQGEAFLEQAIQPYLSAVEANLKPGQATEQFASWRTGNTAEHHLPGFVTGKGTGEGTAALMASSISGGKT